MVPAKSKGESPRTTRVKEIVLLEGLRLLCDQGSAAVTAARISEATGVARSTIYRHWPDHVSLLQATVERIGRPEGSVETTGDLEQDLRNGLVGLRKRMRSKPFRAVFAALLEQANRDSAFAKSQRRLVDGVLQPIRSALICAQEDGRLPSSVDVGEATLMLASPLLAQHVMLRARIDDALIERALQLFLASISRS